MQKDKLHFCPEDSVGVNYLKKTTTQQQLLTSTELLKYNSLQRAITFFFYQKF